MKRVVKNKWLSDWAVKVIAIDQKKDWKKDYQGLVKESITASGFVKYSQTKQEPDENIKGWFKTYRRWIYQGSHHLYIGEFVYVYSTSIMY